MCIVALVSSDRSLLYCSFSNRVGKRRAVTVLHALFQVLYVDFWSVLVVFTGWFPTLWFVSCCVCVFFFFSPPDTQGHPWRIQVLLCRKECSTSRVWFLIFILLAVCVLLCYFLGKWITEQSHCSYMVVILNFQNEAIIYLIFFFWSWSTQQQAGDCLFPESSTSLFSEKKIPHTANFCEQWSCSPGLHFPGILPGDGKY